MSRVRIAPEYPELVIADTGQIMGPKGRWLSLFPNPRNPYLHFNIYRGGRWTQLPVHVVVCTAFHGPRPPGLVTRHLNGDPTDNRASNLCWGTRQENEADKILHGTHLVGERKPQAKLTEADVLRIRADHADGAVQVALATRHGVSQAQISAIILRKTWRHV